MKLANHCLRAVVWEHSRLLNYLHARLLEFFQTVGGTGTVGIRGGPASTLLLWLQSCRAQMPCNQMAPGWKPSCLGMSPATVVNKAAELPEKSDRGVQWPPSSWASSGQRQGITRSGAWVPITLYCWLTETQATSSVPLSLHFVNL